MSVHCLGHMCSRPWTTPPPPPGGVWVVGWVVRGWLGGGLGLFRVGIGLV